MINKEPIYAIMVCTKIEEHIYTMKDENGNEKEKPSGFPDFGATRVVGFYHEKENAIDAVKENAGDIWETCYDYAIVETVEPGLYQSSHDRWIFKHNPSTGGYDEIPEPEILNHTVGITIG